MAEPFAAGSTVAGVVVVSGFSAVSLFSGLDGNALVGAFAGAALFVLRAQDMHIVRRLLYFIVSICAGYLVAPEIMRLTPLRSPAVAALVAAAVVVTLINKGLDSMTSMSFGDFVGRLGNWLSKWKDTK